MYEVASRAAQLATSKWLSRMEHVHQPRSGFAGPNEAMTLTKQAITCSAAFELSRLATCPCISYVPCASNHAHALQQWQPSRDCCHPHRSRSFHFSLLASCCKFGCASCAMANNYLMAASDEDKIFVYHHLPRDRIRLLQLWHVNDQLFGTIDDYQRHQAPSYRALSYTWSYSWGPNDGKFALPLGPRGEVLHVSKNLADFLLMRARNQSKEYLWIDQICLDQRNEVERNEQVQAMGDVYKHAQEVLIWLGLPGSDTIKSLARLLALARDESDL